MEGGDRGETWRRSGLLGCMAGVFVNDMLFSRASSALSDGTLDLVHYVLLKNYQDALMLLWGMVASNRACTEVNHVES